MDSRFRATPRDLAISLMVAAALWLLLPIIAFFVSPVGCAWLFGVGGCVQ